MERKIDVKKLALLGMMTAIVFVSNYIQITLPVAFGGVTRLHVANGFCILAGFLLGPVFGGLSAGLGSAFFDLLNPIYAPSAPFTFAFKFLMAFIGGKISWIGKSKGYSANKNLIGSIFGAFTYVFLYLSKTFITQKFIVGLPIEGVLAVLIKKGTASVINAIFAIIIANILIKILNPLVNKKEV